MASAAEIARLKAIAPEAVLVGYSDAQLSELLDQHNSDVRRVAGLLWEERVNQTASFVDIKEGSSSRAMRQEFENAVQMAVMYLGGDFHSRTTRGTRVHQIVRD